MAVTYKAPGTYALGGISAPSRGTGQAFRAGLTTAQQRREREQAMQLRASAEQRAQEQFEMAKADRARAAAQAARIQQAQAEFARNNRPTGLTIPDIASTSAPPPAGMRLPAGPTTPSAVSPSLPSVDTTPPPPPAEVPLSMGMTPAGTAGGVQVASLDPQEAFRLAFQTRPDLFGGGGDIAGAISGIPAGALLTGQPVRAEFSGIPFDVYPDGRIVNTVTNTELPMTGEYDALRTMLTEQAGVGVAPQADVTTPGFTEVDPQAPAFIQDVQGLLRGGDIASAINRIGDRLATGGYGPMGSPLGAAVGYFTDTPEEAARRTAVAGALDWFRDPANVQFLQENPGLIAEAAADPVTFVARQTATQQAGVEQPTPDTTQGPMTEAPAQPPAPDVGTALTRPTTPTIDVSPTGRLSGVTMAPSAAEDVNAIAAQTGGDISEFYLRNPASIFTTADNAYRDIQRWEGLIRYYQQIGDLQGVVQAEIDLGQARQAFSDMSGQLALAGVQLDNYGPLQLHLQQVYPDGTVEVRPYTDNTVEIFVDGDSIRRDNKNDLLVALASAFNEEYRAGQAALSAQAAELRSLLIEQELETRGAIALESIQQQGRLDLKLLEAELARLENEGEVTLKRIDDPTGLQRPIFEYRAGDGPPRYITFREIPGDGDTPLLQYDFVPLPGSE